MEQQYTEEELGQMQQDQEDAEMQYYPDYPRPIDDGNLFTLFRRVLKQKDNSKVANLNKEELGNLFISVRDCQKIAELANQLGHQTFAEFFKKQADIILQTSASKKGWFVELFVSQKRYSAQRSTEQVQPAQGGRRKWSWGRNITPPQ